MYDKGLTFVEMCSYIVPNISMFEICYFAQDKAVFHLTACNLNFKETVRERGILQTWP